MNIKSLSLVLLREAYMRYKLKVKKNKLIGVLLNRIVISLINRIIIFLGTIFISIVVFFYAIKPKHKVEFTSEVKPILNKHCISCHGGVKKSAGFSVLFESEALGVTQSGKPSIIPGNSSKSEFIKRSHYTDPEMSMPYKKPALSEAEIKTLTNWI